MTSGHRLAGQFAISLLLLFCAACGEKKEAPGAKPAGPAVAVVVAQVQQKNVPIYVEMTARADASDSVDIRARVKAFLKTQDYQEGTMVNKGQLLFTLDKSEYEAAMMQAKAQLAKAESDLAQARDRTTIDTAQANLDIANAQLNKTTVDVNRLKPLAAQRAVPQQDYDNATAAQTAARADVEGKKASLNTAKVNQTASIQQAQAAVESGKASVAQAQLNLDYCVITSPISGIAGVRQVAPGNLVGGSEATLLATVSNMNPMRVYVSISERDYLMYQRMQTEGKIKDRGGALELIMADGSTFPYKGRVIITGREVDTKTGTLSIVAEFPNPKALLRPGQFGRVRLASTTVENAILVPQKAVTEMQSAQTVFVVGADNKVQLRSVVLADRVGLDYIVTEGLKAGEKIVVEGIQKVRPGATVIPTEKPLTTEKAEAKKGI